jgi:hypothetical protein
LQPAALVLRSHRATAERVVVCQGVRSQGPADRPGDPVPEDSQDQGEAQIELRKLLVLSRAGLWSVPALLRGLRLGRQSARVAVRAAVRRHPRPWPGRRLAARGNHVVLLDLLGHGRSDKPWHAAPNRMDLYAEQVLCLLDELGADQVVLGGVSVGTNSAPTWEPKRLRLRVFVVAGRLARSGRRLQLASLNTGPRPPTSPPPSPGCRPSRPTDQPEPPLRPGKVNTRGCRTRPPAATTGQPSTAGT